MSAFKPGDWALIEVAVETASDADGWLYVGNRAERMVMHASALRPVLPTLMEPTEADLEALPVGTVMRGADEGDTFVVERGGIGWWGAGLARARTSASLARDMLTWQVLWMPEVEA